MRPRAAIAAFALLAPVFAAAQSVLEPEILLLSRIKRHMKQESTRFPDYTCLETTQRHNRPGVKNAMKAVDTVRLEVLFTGRHEMYAAPGESNFREDSPSAFSVSGLTATGLFASFLQSLFIHDNASWTWRGHEVDRPGGEAVNRPGRRTVRYDYRVPLLTSGWHLQVTGKGDLVAMKGSIWVDAESLDLLRLRVEADEIPAALGVIEAVIVMDYARTRIGEANVLLPQTGEVTMLHYSGDMSRNVLDYTHCRSFQTESVLSFATSNVRFDAPPAAAVKAPAAARTMPLPAGLLVTLTIESPLSEKDAIGTTLEAAVVADVLNGRQVIIPAGAPVTGRLRRLDRDEESGGFTVGIEFTEVRAADRVYRFYADLQTAVGRGVDAIRDGISTPVLPGIGFLLVKGTRFEMPPGALLTWKTRPPGR
jgi:hypothetical protein